METRHGRRNAVTHTLVEDRVERSLLLLTVVPLREDWAHGVPIPDGNAASDLLRSRLAEVHVLTRVGIYLRRSRRADGVAIEVSLSRPVAPPAANALVIRAVPSRPYCHVVSQPVDGHL